MPRHLQALDLVNNEIWTEASAVPEVPRITIAKEAHDTKVLICTGKNDSPSKGLLSAISSYMKPADSSKFQELWTVKVEHSLLGKTFNFNQGLSFL
jgi:hypothetical protein